VPTAGVEGIELHYERAGDGEPLLLIQGMSGTHRSWGQPFLSELEQDFDCISFDHRGVGYSSRVHEPFTIAELAADAVGLLDAIGVERAHLLGISMGGMVAQDLALAYPERLRSLTLGGTYCGGPGSQLMDPADFQTLVDAMASGSQERVFRASWELNLSPGFRADEGRYAEFKAMAEAVPVPQETVQLQLQAVVAHDTTAQLPNLGLQTLVIHGSADRVLPFVNGAQIAALMPDAYLERLEDVGHMFWWEQPERSAALIRDHSLASA
jgi:pimeloyl-ACP methyl ester carboxylesterase